MTEMDPVQPQCPVCGTEFLPMRKDQKYCSGNCRKHKSRNASRGDRANENKRSSHEHYERARRLEELIYSTIPNERLGVMKSILDHCLHDACLRRILTDPLLLNEEPTEYSYRKNIAKAASAYARKFFGVSIKTYIQQAQFQTLNEEFTVAFKHRRTRPHGSRNEQYVEQDAREFLERLREDRAKKLKDGTIKPLAA